MTDKINSHFCMSVPGSCF